MKNQKNLKFNLNKPTKDILLPNKQVKKYLNVLKI